MTEQTPPGKLQSASNLWSCCPELPCFQTQTHREQFVWLCCLCAHSSGTMVCLALPALHRAGAVTVCRDQSNHQWAAGEFFPSHFSQVLEVQVHLGFAYVKSWNSIFVFYYFEVLFLFPPRVITWIDCFYLQSHLEGLAFLTSFSIPGRFSVVLILAKNWKHTTCFQLLPGPHCASCLKKKLLWFIRALRKVIFLTLANLPLPHAYLH